MTKTIPETIKTVTESGSSSNTPDQSQQTDLQSLIIDIETTATRYHDELANTLRFKTRKESLISSTIYFVPALLTCILLNIARNADTPNISPLERVKPTNQLQPIFLFLFFARFGYDILGIIPTLSYPASSKAELETTHKNLMLAINQFRQHYNAIAIKTITQDEAEETVLIHQVIRDFLRHPPYSPSVAIASKLNVSDDFFILLATIKGFDLSKLSTSDDHASNPENPICKP